MAAILGRLGELWAQTGTASAFTTEACSLVSGSTYKITNAAKRQWDPATAVLVYDNAVLQTTGYILQAPIGRIVFDSAPTTPVTVTGASFSTVQVGLVQSWDLNITSQVYEVTSIGDTTRTYVGDSFPEWDGSFERFYEDDTWQERSSANATAGTDGGYKFILKCYEDEPSDRVWIGYVTFTNWTQSTPIELVTESIQFRGDGAPYYIADET